MDNHRAVIRYLGLKGLTSKEIHKNMVDTLGKNVPLNSMEKMWHAKFKRGGDSLEDDLRRRRPVTVTTQETIAKSHDIIMADRRVTEYYIVSKLDISQDRIHIVIHNELHMSIVMSQSSLDLI